MQTDLHDSVARTAEGRRAEQILRSCVHCGFCNATCPTYLLTGDELDGPRGRIYLIKSMLEEGEANAVARQHLDRCLTCRACETTCPSGVEYGELLEVGRVYVESRLTRPALQSWVRRWLKAVVPNPSIFRRWARAGGWFRWLLPTRLRAHLPRVAKPLEVRAQTAHARKVLLLQGCVQQVATPSVNDAFMNLLEKGGFEVLRSAEEGCCGSLALHLGDRDEALAQVRHNVDALAALSEQVDAVVSTASGCGVTYKEYVRLLEHDRDYAARVAPLVRKLVDASEFVASADLSIERVPGVANVAWQAPCTLQHGQGIRDLVESLLQRAGYHLVHVDDDHLCCGSAGTYSLLQPELADALREQKLSALGANGPDVIATANVGCQMHLASRSAVPVVHWLELLR